MFREVDQDKDIISQINEIYRGNLNEEEAEAHQIIKDIMTSSPQRGEDFQGNSQIQQLSNTIKRERYGSDNKKSSGSNSGSNI